MIIIILAIIRKFAKITINFYNDKINNININPELIETTIFAIRAPPPPSGGWSEWLSQIGRAHV